jgi:putative flippase GtrA
MTRFDQIARFGVVGVTATAVHVAIGMGLNSGAGMAPFCANLVAFCCALVVSYLGQTRLTFPWSAAGHGAFARFTLVALVGLCLNQAIVWLVTSVLARPYWLALAIIVATVPVTTFLLLKSWALRR